MQLMAWPILALLEAQFMGYFLDFMFQQNYALIVGIYYWVLAQHHFRRENYISKGLLNFLACWLMHLKR